MHDFAALLSPIHPYAIELKTAEYEQVENLQPVLIYKHAADISNVCDGGRWRTRHRPQFPTQAQ